VLEAVFSPQGLINGVVIVAVFVLLLPWLALLGLPLAALAGVAMVGLGLLSRVFVETPELRRVWTSLRGPKVRKSKGGLHENVRAISN
jgi:hypothetical protein